MKVKLASLLCHKEDFSPKIHPSSYLTNSPKKKTLGSFILGRVIPLSWSKICLLTLLSILYSIKIDLQHISYTLDLFLEKKNVKGEKEFAKRWQNSKIWSYILSVYVATHFTPVNSTTFLGALNNYSACVSQLFSPKENWNATIHIFEISWKI